MRAVRLARACLIAGLCLFAGAPNAQAAPDYPTRPLRMIVPFGPGGAGDFVARILQPKLSDLLGQQVIVDNRPGAAGNIGVETAANASPDGHVFLLGNVGAMAINPNVTPGWSIIPLRDFVAVTQVVDVPGALVVHPAIPVQSASQLAAYLKTRPGQLNFGSSGGAGQNRLETEIFMQHSGTKMVHVPYKGGAGQAVTALLANEVQVMFITFSSALNHVKSGRLRMLGVIAPGRVDVMPDVPTMREQGFQEMVNGSWQGIYLPRNAPSHAVRRLFEALGAAAQQPDFTRRLADGGAIAVVSASPQAFAKFNADETQRFGRLISGARLELD